MDTDTNQVESAQALVSDYRMADDTLSVLYTAKEHIKKQAEQEVRALEWAKKSRMRAIERYFDAQVDAIEADAKAAQADIEIGLQAEREIIAYVDLIKEMVSKSGYAARQYVQEELEYRLPYKGRFPVLHFQPICESPAIALYAVIAQNSRPTNKYSLWVVGNAIVLPREHYHAEIEYREGHGYDKRPQYQVEVKVASSKQELIKYLEKYVLSLNANTEVIQQIRQVKIAADGYYRDMLDCAHLKMSDFEGLSGE